jgi:hypothetical protein
MARFVRTVSRPALTSFLVFAVASAAAVPQDLSKYRNFQLGADLPTIAKQWVRAHLKRRLSSAARPSYRTWRGRAQPLGPSSQAESVQEVVFSFYDGELFRIAIAYDRYETEGLRADDFIEAISAMYGIAEIPTPPAKAVQGSHGDEEEIIARWQDSQYCFELIRSSYDPTFRLVGALKRLQAPEKAAITEAKRLDDLEAPQRDAARIADEKEVERAKLEKSRLVNKPKFRP